MSLHTDLASVVVDRYVADRDGLAAGGEV